MPEEWATSAQWVESCMDFRNSLDTVQKRMISCPCWELNPDSSVHDINSIRIKLKCNCSTEMDVCLTSKCHQVHVLSTCLSLAHELSI
jgi:hypothetical protein